VFATLAGIRCDTQTLKDDTEFPLCAARDKLQIPRFARDDKF